VNSASWTILVRTCLLFANDCTCLSTLLTLSYFLSLSLSLSVLFMLDKNSIHGDGDKVCGLNLDIFTSDCEDPEVVCTCCSKCCEDQDEDCNADNELYNYEASFETGYTQDGYDLDPQEFVPAK